MIRLRSLLVFAAAAALAVPAAASADANPTRVTLAPQAIYVSPQQINLEIGLSCTEGQFYNINASVVQQRGPFMQVFGSGFASGQCTGQHKQVAVPVFGFGFPGWQLGEAVATVSACAFACDATARTIRITL
jgi:hypothetical protein